MEFKHLEGLNPVSKIEPERLLLRCPYCGREATLDGRGQDIRLIGPMGELEHLISGQRVCPNPQCRGLIFVVYKENSREIFASYPPERLDFDATGLPGNVKEPLEEAVDCHSQGSYKASALMIRRTLEAVCEDRGAGGKTLFDRIEDLGTHVVIHTDLIDGLHNLRLLGNDAGHVEARVYVEVGQTEVEAAVQVTKLILSATYQTGETLDALNALKAQDPES
jgi:hypothetical protein